VTEPLDDLARRYWDLRLETTPSVAPIEGDFRFCGAIEDWSADHEATTRSRLAALLNDVTALAAADLSSGEQVTAGLLRAELSDEIESIDLRMIELASNQMTGPHAMYLQLPAQTIYPDPSSAAEVADRYRRMPATLEGLMQRFREGLESGRTPARLSIERSLMQLDGYLATDSAEDVFTTVGGPANWDGETEWRAAMADVVAQHVRPAFARFRGELSDELLPVARDDQHAGLCHLADGPELYHSAIRRHTSLQLGAEEIHQIGLDEIAALADEYRSIGSGPFDTTDLEEIFRHLRSDADLRYDDRAEILDAAGASLARAKDAMGDWFGVVPRADCVIEPVPEFMEAAMPPAYYWPPSPEGGRPGTYYVNTHHPGEQSRVESQAIGYHESIPGHHLQIAIATELPDLPIFQRRSMSNTAYVEGWGLYAERLADEMGLYSTVLDRLGMLVADSWRAGRLVVDTGIHALGWSRQQAIDWMTSHTPIAPDTIAVEIDRYVAMPGQALSYKLGQREIFRLRAHAQDQLGDRFEIAGFHDVLLGSGTVSLPILGDLIDRWITSR
jgi:uncharacterized protein (DUF885 family)